MDGKKLAYSELLEKIEENNEVIYTVNEMLTKASSSSLDVLFATHGHYTEEGNKIVGDVIANFIIEQIKINPEGQ